MLTAQRIDTLMGAYVEGPHLLERALANIPTEELRFTPGPEHWSIHENVIHMADVELAYAIRIRYLLAEPAKIPLSFYGFQWSRALDYPSQSLDEARTLFRAVRTGTAAFLRTLPHPAWEKVGLHWDQDGAGSELRTLTPARAVEIFIEHVQYHLRTITKRRGQYTQAQGGT